MSVKRRRIVGVVAVVVAVAAVVGVAAWAGGTAETYNSPGIAPYRLQVFDEVRVEGATIYLIGRSQRQNALYLAVSDTGFVAWDNR